MSLRKQSTRHNTSISPTKNIRVVSPQKRVLISNQKGRALTQKVSKEALTKLFSRLKVNSTNRAFTPNRKAEKSFRTTNCGNKSFRLGRSSLVSRNG